MTSAYDAEPGPLADEAAKLFEALGAWARGAGDEVPIATGSPECRLCPLCQAIGLLRHARPETFAHLAEASVALTAALRSVVDAHSHPSPTRGGVERIDLDDEPTWTGAR